MNGSRRITIPLGVRGAMLLLLPGLAACALEHGADASGVVVRDSAGIAIVETGQATWTNGSTAWMVGMRPRIEIGVIDGEAPYLFDRVVGATRLDDGTIVVANGGTVELRFFDESGRYLRSILRKGSGPGEVQYLRGLGRCSADSLFVFDLNWQASVFEPGGEFVRQLALREPGLPRTPYNVACSPDGRFLISGWGAMSGPQIGFFRSMTHVWVLDPEGLEVASLGEHLGSERLGTLRGSGPHPFGRFTTFAADLDGIYLGDGERYEVRRYARDGRLARIQRAPREDLTIGAERLDAYRGEQLARVSETRRPDVERELREMPMPDGLPAFVDMRVDPDGFLWVARFRSAGDDTQRWGIFAPDGVFLGHVAMPDRFTVHEIGRDYVLGVSRDADGVERVVLHHLDRGQGGTAPR